MDITKRAKEEIETRLEKIENFIAHKGIGSSYLERAKKVQRNLNIAIVMASVVTLAGITVWAVSKMDDDDE